MLLKRLKGLETLIKDISAIVNKSQELKKIKRENKESLSKSEKKELTEKEKEIKSKRKEIREKLLKFTARIPVYMYLTDNREQTLKDVITMIEPELFQKVTELTIPDFELLVNIGVFNAQNMNSAVYAFKRFEDASLNYTGISKHDELVIGGYNTQITKTVYTNLA